MQEDAVKMGADAVLNVRFTTSVVMQGASEILAYGTAVKLKQMELLYWVFTLPKIFYSLLYLLLAISFTSE